MVIVGMDYFQNKCKKKLVEWYNNAHAEYPMNLPIIDENDVFVVWSCKTLQNYKALLGTSINGDGIYVEFTYNGDKEELYMDVYKKLENVCFKE